MDWETLDVKGLVSLKSAATLVGIWVIYRIFIALYNISPLHPLSRFPGPKIAAASYVYEAYYDWWRVGRYGKVIREMHEQYGTGSSRLTIDHLTNKLRPHCQN